MKFSFYPLWSLLNWRKLFSTKGSFYPLNRAATVSQPLDVFVQRFSVGWIYRGSDVHAALVRAWQCHAPTDVLHPTLELLYIISNRFMAI
ncbi:hypothetical protein [Funiculus sociatus]|uniref:hypothetical protein n=1 Tax=Funiculus sociatus TaxID=450527 RepID=UPI0019907865|nr:hypothetical protein [Trichocoleus sp. FACHB-69]